MRPNGPHGLHALTHNEWQAEQTHRGPAYACASEETASDTDPARQPNDAQCKVRAALQVPERPKASAGGCNSAAARAKQTGQGQLARFRFRRSRRQPKSSWSPTMRPQIHHPRSSASTNTSQQKKPQTFNNAVAFNHALSCERATGSVDASKRGTCPACSTWRAASRITKACPES